MGLLGLQARWYTLQILKVIKDDMPEQIKSATITLLDTLTTLPYRSSKVFHKVKIWLDPSKENIDSHAFFYDESHLEHKEILYHDLKRYFPGLDIREGVNLPFVNGHIYLPKHDFHISIQSEINYAGGIYQLSGLGLFKYALLRKLGYRVMFIPSIVIGDNSAMVPYREGIEMMLGQR